MNTEPNDSFLEPLLEEVVGNRHPPDLTARILAAWEAQQLVRSVVEKAPVIVPTHTARRRERTGNWLPLFASLMSAAAVMALAYLAFSWSAKEQQLTIVPSDKKTESLSEKPANTNHIATTKPPVINKKSPVVEQPVPVETFAASLQESVLVPPSRELTTASVGESNTQSISHVPAATSPQATAKVVSFVNTHLQTVWQEHKVTAAPEVTDSQWCRRLFLHVLGRIPNVAELQSFEKNKHTEKRLELVEQLLSSKPYATEYARYWSTVWANILIGRGVGLERNEKVSRAGLEEYLYTSLLNNKPYDQLVRELLTATGTGQPDADGFHGATNFLLAHADAQNIAATTRCCRLFLGLNLHSMQYEETPAELKKQSQFWGMNAFFRQMQVRHSDRNDPPLLLDFDYLGEDGRDESGLVFFELPNGVLQATPAVFFDGRHATVASGYVSHQPRRQQFAEYVVTSERFAPAIVNRLWSHFHGYGFTIPVDDLGDMTTIPHAELLQDLSQQFTAHNFDLKALLRWLALSESFQTSSEQPRHNLADNPDQGTAPLFSYYYTRPMAAEEVIRSLQIAAKMRQKTNATQARVDWLAQYQKSQSIPGNNTNIIPNIPHGLMKQVTSPGLDSQLQHVIQSQAPLSQKVEQLFLASLSRRPTPAELKAASQLAGMTGANEAAALEDIWWALLNSSEFQFDH
jgi:Protein of unknown function (DUF1549)/Protein of unknown function (DUF1553)